MAVPCAHRHGPHKRAGCLSPFHGGNSVCAYTTGLQDMESSLRNWFPYNRLAASPAGLQTAAPRSVPSLPLTASHRPAVLCLPTERLLVLILAFPRIRICRGGFAAAFSPPCLCDDIQLTIAPSILQEVNLINLVDVF